MKLGHVFYLLRFLIDALCDINKGSQLLQSTFETECEMIIFCLVVSRYELHAVALVWIVWMTYIQDYSKGKRKPKPTRLAGGGDIGDKNKYARNLSRMEWHESI